MNSNDFSHLKSFNKHQLLLVLVSFLALACPSRSPEVVRISGHTMGTTYSILLYAEQVVNDQELQRQVESRLAEINGVMSNWEPESDLSRFNRASLDEPVLISPDTRLVLAEARRIHKLLEGAFDPTLGPLIDLWGFGAKPKTVEPPDDLAIQETLAFVGLSRVLNRGEKAIGKEVEGISLNLSAIAKGYAVDEVAKLLEEKGFKTFAVEIGGEWVVRGLKPDGGTWRIGIENPSVEVPAPYAIAYLKDKAIATSGDYHNYFMHEGIRYSHILDPRTGKPIPSRVALLSVIADNCMLADGLATGLMVMGPEKAIAVVDQIPGVECFMLTRDGQTQEDLRVWLSAGMAKYLDPNLPR